jgi:hypothetical protein
MNKFACSLLVALLSISCTKRLEHAGQTTYEAGKYPYACSLQMNLPEGAERLKRQQFFAREEAYYQLDKVETLVLNHFGRDYQGMITRIKTRSVGEFFETQTSCHDESDYIDWDRVYLVEDFQAEKTYSFSYVDQLVARIDLRKAKVLAQLDLSFKGRKQLTVDSSLKSADQTPKKKFSPAFLKNRTHFFKIDEQTFLVSEYSIKKKSTIRETGTNPRNGDRVYEDDTLYTEIIRHSWFKKVPGTN